MSAAHDPIDPRLIAAIEAEVAQRGPGKKIGREIPFCCPVHDDERPSARWNPEKATWYCDPCGPKDAGHYGAINLARLLGIPLPDRPDAPRASQAAPVQQRVTASFTYQTAKGDDAYISERVEPGAHGRAKDFRVRLPSAARLGIGDTPRVIYRLPELLAADLAEPVLIVEGERHVDLLRSWGFVATTNLGGAGKFRQADADHLRRRHIILLADNDDPGRRHADQVGALCRGVAASIRDLRLPGLPAKGDVIDWADAGGTAEVLAELVTTAPAWIPPADADLLTRLADLEARGDMTPCPELVAQVETLTAAVARRDRQLEASTAALRRMAQDRAVLLEAARHPRTSGAVGAFWELAQHLRHQPTIERRIVLKDVARRGGASPAKVTRLVRDLETSALAVRRDEKPAQDGRPKLTEVYAALAVAPPAAPGVHDETGALTQAATARAMLRTMPNTARVSEAGNTHGGKRVPGWCPTCRTNTRHTVERRRIERCDVCKEIIDDTLTVLAVAADGTSETTYHGAPHGQTPSPTPIRAMQTETKIRKETGFQDAPRRPASAPTAGQYVSTPVGAGLVTGEISAGQVRVIDVDGSDGWHRAGDVAPAHPYHVAAVARRKGAPIPPDVIAEAARIGAPFRSDVLVPVQDAYPTSMSAD